MKSNSIIYEPKGPGVEEVVDCRTMLNADQEAAACPCAPGLLAWVLANIRPVVPFPVRGMPGLYKVDDSLVRFE